MKTNNDFQKVPAGVRFDADVQVYSLAAFHIEDTRCASYARRRLDLRARCIGGRTSCTKKSDINV